MRTLFYHIKMNPTINLISMTHHLCERREYVFIIFWEYLIIFLYIHTFFNGKKKTSIITNIIIKISLIILIYYFLNLSLNQKNVWCVSLFLYISLSLSSTIVSPLLFHLYRLPAEKKKKTEQCRVPHGGSVFALERSWQPKLEEWKAFSDPTRKAFSNPTTLQQNVFLVTKISEEIFFVTKNTALVTKYEFRH